MGRSLAKPPAATVGVTYAVMTLANLIARNTAQHTLARADLSLNGWRLLRFLSGADDRSAAGAVVGLAMDKTTVGRAVAELRKASLVRLAVNRRDRRQSLIALTPRGRRLHHRIVSIDRAVDQSFEQRLTARERAALAPILAKLSHHARELLRSEP